MNVQIEEASTKYACMTNGHPGYDPAIKKAFIEGADYALTHEWISIEESLPKIDEDVLTAVPHNYGPATFEVAYWDGEDWYTQSGDHIRPTLWMEIPSVEPRKRGKMKESVDEEPKVKKYLVGEYVRVSDDARLPEEFRGHVGKVVLIPTDVQRTVDVGGGVVPQVFHIDHLKPAIPPSPRSRKNKIPECPGHIGKDSEMVDNIIKDGFRDHNRLHIAAMAMQGFLSSNSSGDPHEIAHYALAMADALIAECEKGG